MRIPSPPNPSEPQSTDAKPRNPNTARRRNLPDFLETAISTTTGHDDDDHEGQDDEDEELLPPTNIAMTSSARILPPLLSPGAVVGTRLQKHITTLFALSEPDSLRLENCEDAVAEFEDRYRRALAKEGIVRRILGEGRDVVVDGSGGNSGGGGGGGGGEGEVEDMVEAKIVSGRSNGLQGLEEQGDLEVEIR